MAVDRRHGGALGDVAVERHLVRPRRQPTDRVDRERSGERRTVRIHLDRHRALEVAHHVDRDIGRGVRGPHGEVELGAEAECRVPADRHGRGVRDRRPGPETDQRRQRYGPTEGPHAKFAPTPWARRRDVEHECGRGDGQTAVVEGRSLVGERSDTEEVARRVDILENWRWMIVGGALVFGYIVGHLEIFSTIFGK